LAKDEEKPETPAEESGESTPKEGKAKKAKEKKEKSPQEKVRDRGPVSADFRYIVRLASTDLDGFRPVMYALSDIKGIGIRTGALVADMVDVPRAERIGNLSEAQVERLSAKLAELPAIAPGWMLNRQYDWETGEDRHMFGPDWALEVRNDVNRMRKIRSYKGVRHETGKKVRGQRSKSNGRKGLALGVQRGAALAAAKAAATEAEGGPKAGAPAAAAPAAAAPAAAKPAEKKAPEKKAPEAKK
jgi:small subunit ribosomal protein S13